MTTDPLEAAIKRVLNDRRIFWMPQELINKVDWARLREAASRADHSVTRQVLINAQNSLKAKIDAERDSEKRQKLEENKVLLEGLSNRIENNSSFATRLLELLESFGPLRCNLPNMEDFGKVIEGHGRPTAEQFFTYKIQKEKDHHRRQALTALFEVVKELYDCHVEPLEIAFFVRKIDSLTQLVEVL